jgi:hypothetical protein
MKQRFSNLFWGIILILAGIVFLAQNMGYIESDNIQAWTIVFAAGSVLFFISYFVNGVKQWGWLFPALMSAALAGVLMMVDTEMEGAAMGGLVMAAVAIPFWVAFLVSPKQNWWALIPGWVMSAITAVVFFTDRVQGEWIGSIIMLAIAVPFYVVYFTNRSRWWALIPAWVTSVLTVIIFLSTLIPGEIVGTIVLLAIALPFLVVYIRDRTNWWALIPGGIMGTIAFIPLLTLLGDEEWVAPIIVFLLAAPFLVIAILSKKSWWAIIPAGVFISAGIISVLGIFLEPGPGVWSLGNGIFFVGMGATFGVLWLLRNKYDTGWAKIPAIVLAIIGVVSASISQYWPIIIIFAGLWTLYLALKPKKKTAA